MSYSRPTVPSLSLPTLSIESRTDHAAVLAAELCLLDGLMTVPFWHLEGNPLVLSLGTSGMLLTKLFAVAALLGLWFHWDGIRDSTISQACVWFLCGLYAVVVATNAIILLGFA